MTERELLGDLVKHLEQRVAAAVSDCLLRCEEAGLTDNECYPRVAAMLGLFAAEFISEGTTLTPGEIGDMLARGLATNQQRAGH